MSNRPSKKQLLEATAELLRVYKGKPNDKDVIALCEAILIEYKGAVQ